MIIYWFWCGEFKNCKKTVARSYMRLKVTFGNVRGMPVLYKYLLYNCCRITFDSR